jgi:hypothetical protein
MVLKNSLDFLERCLARGRPNPRSGRVRDPSSWLCQAHITAPPLLATSPSLLSLWPRRLLSAVIIKLVVHFSTTPLVPLTAHTPLTGEAVPPPPRLTANLLSIHRRLLTSSTAAADDSPKPPNPNLDTRHHCSRRPGLRHRSPSPLP